MQCWWWSTHRYFRFITSIRICGRFRQFSHLRFVSLSSVVFRPLHTVSTYTAVVSTTSFIAAATSPPSHFTPIPSSSSSIMSTAPPAPAPQANGGIRHVSTIIDGGWVLPMAPDPRTVLENTSVIIDDDVIIDILPTDTAHTLYTSVEHLNRTSHVILPGFINGHTHAGMTYLRGRGDDQALMPWLRETVWPIEGEFASKPEFCRDGTLLACCEMLRGGVTTFADMYLFSESTALAVTKEIGMRAVMGLVMFVFPTAYAGTPEEYHERAEKVLKEFGYVENDVNGNEGVKHESLVTFALAPHAPYTVRSEDWERVGETAKRYNVRVHTHMHETRNEVEASKALNRCDSACHLSDQACTPLEDLHSRNVVSERFIAAHMVHLSESDFDICVSSKMHVIHCPTSNSKLGSGFCAAHKLRAAGVNVGLGTDSACSNNKLDMLSEMRLAALNAKNLTNDATVFPAWQVLEMGTINGAKAFGLEDVTGSIEKGKKADLVVFDVESTPGNSPMFDPAAAVVYAAEREDVRDVMVNGKVLLREKEFVNVDVKDVMKRMTYWKGQIMNKFPMTKKRKGSE